MQLLVPEIIIRLTAEKFPDCFVVWRAFVEAFIDNIMWHLTSIDWEGSAMFIVIVLAILALFKQWHIVLITLLTTALAWGAEDMIIMNLETNMEIISVPLLVYCAGGGIALILCLIAFFKLAV